MATSLAHTEAGPRSLTRPALARLRQDTRPHKNLKISCHTGEPQRTYSCKEAHRLRVALSSVDSAPEKETAMDKILLTPIEAAAALGIGRSKLYELLQSGQLHSVHIGRCRRVPAEAVHSFASALRGPRSSG